MLGFIRRWMVKEDLDYCHEYPLWKKIIIAAKEERFERRSKLFDRCDRMQKFFGR